ncbi:hypothetical protein FSP39_021037 [Pinctada imbricata]|uniref:Potassium voltage-gated channel subfamily H member 8 n=1 Tax=Pinctada imbricata TaxID=66713 RepID=A0AA88XDQ5_PINIB|nr:hypothetical protein FSP39_021037 [Pinctada imbricata]
MGKSCACRFLYGDSTDTGEKAKIDEALDMKKELKTEILLYSKTGGTFWCLLDIVPIKNEKSQVVLFLVSHKDITRDRSSSAGIPIRESADSGSYDSKNPYRFYKLLNIDFLSAGPDDTFRPPFGRGREEPELPSNCNYQRRRSRAVLYHLSGQFDKQNKAKSKLQQLNKLTGSISGKMPEYKVQEVKKSKYIIAHYGIFKIGWDWLILLCTFYTAIMVPYNAAFTVVKGPDDQEAGSSNMTSTTKQRSTMKDSIYPDVVVEILFMIDIVLNFRTSFLSKSGQIVYASRLIVINYVKGWFLLDLLAAIPFDFLILLDVTTTTPVHLLKIARMLRLARLLQKIDRYSQYSAMIVALFMCMFTLLAHWLACVWYAIGKGELEDSRPDWSVGWLFELGERIEKPVNRTNPPDVLTSYITALYFTCSSLTSVGFGNVSANTNAEKVFSVCAMLIGAMMHAVVFGNVTAIIQRMYARRANYHSKTKDLKDFFRTHHIPKRLKHRMQEYFQTMWSMNNGIDTADILKDFPDELRGEINLHLHKDILKLPIFDISPQGCLKSISLHTKRAFSAPGEFLVHKGDAVNYVYLLCSGSMEVLKEELVVAILGKGDLFGTDINFDDPIAISSCDVRSLTYCELQCIHMKGLTDVLSLYPDFAEKFAQDIRHDLTYNLKENYEESESEGEYLPVGRVKTLPSISEDEEEESDSDNVFSDKTKSPNTPTTSPKANSKDTSPLLGDKKEKEFTFQIPNGDIPMSPRETPLRSRRRTSILPPARSSSRDRKRQRHSSKQASSQPETPVSVSGMEGLSASVHSLHTEIETTKSNMKQMEKKISDMSLELSSIDRSIKTVIGMLSPNPSVHSMESTDHSFPPYIKPHFSISSPNSDEFFSDTDVNRTSCSTLEVPSTLYKKPESPSVRDRFNKGCHGNKHGGRSHSAKCLHTLSDAGHDADNQAESINVCDKTTDRVSPEIKLPTLEGIYKYNKDDNDQSGHLVTPERVIRHKQTKVYRRAESEPRTFNGLSEATRQKILKEVSLDDIGSKNNNIPRVKSRNYPSRDNNSFLETTDL